MILWISVYNYCLPPIEWLVLYPKRLQHLRAQLLMQNVAVNTPLQLGLADLIYSRAYREHLTTLKPILMAQVEQYRQFIITAFHQVDIGLNQPSGGYAFWIQLPEQITGLGDVSFCATAGITICTR